MQIKERNRGIVGGPGNILPHPTHVAPYRPPHRFGLIRGQRSVGKQQRTNPTQSFQRRLRSAGNRFSHAIDPIVIADRIKDRLTEPLPIPEMPPEIVVRTRGLRSPQIARVDHERRLVLPNRRADVLVENLLVGSPVGQQDGLARHAVGYIAVDDELDRVERRRPSCDRQQQQHEQRTHPVRP